MSLAKYATAEVRFHCDICDRWITEREMIGVTLYQKIIGQACPGCEDTLWTLDDIPVSVTRAFRKIVILEDG